MTKRLSDSKVSSMVICNYIPDGATVTPVDDYAIWLTCADLPNIYGSLANVIADTTAMETLCNNLNALRYMVRSEDVIMPAVLADSDWVAELDGCAYAVTVPTMTSDTAPSGVASASSTYSTTNAAWKAFDKVLTTAGYWRTANGQTANQWLKYQFPYNVHVYKLTYQYNGDAGYTPKNYKIQVSTDDVSYTDAKTGVLPNNITTETMLITNTAAGGDFWKYLIVDMYSGAYVTCIEMQMYGLNLT